MGEQTDLVEELGLNMADLLDTEHKRDTARKVFSMIAQSEGKPGARIWLFLANPQLGDRAPLFVIAEGNTAAVLAAVENYLEYEP